MPRFARWFVVAAWVAVVLAGCGGKDDADNQATSGSPAAQDEQARSGGSVIRRLESECKTLNWVLYTTAYENFVLRYLYDPVFDYNEAGDMIPVLASQLPDVSPDHLRVTVHLRDDIHWHDGVPITAHDVKFSLDKIQDPGIPALNKEAFFEKLDRLDVVDDRTLVFVWKEPFAPSLFAISQLWPIPKHVYGQGDFLTHASNRKPVGSGPFRFDEWRSGQYISLVRYDDYHGQKAYLDRVIFKVVEDDAVALNMLRTGELDEMRATQPQWERQMSEPEFVARYNKYDYYFPQYNYLAWNCESVWFSDPRIRRAMTMLFDRESINTKIYSGYARLVSGPFYINSWAYDKTIKPYPYDPATAKRLLEEAGWTDSDNDGIRDKNGQKFEFELLHAHGSNTAAQLSQLFQEECGKTGIRVNIRQIEASTFFDRVDKSDFSAAILGWRLDLDPDVFDTFHSAMTPPNGLNHVHYSNPHVDSLLVAGRSEFDQAKRQRIYHQVHRLIHEDQPYTFINTVPDKRPIAKRIHGVKFGWNGPYDFWPGASYWWVDDAPGDAASAR
ncbi:MAG TPA: peptide-binding protein [Candidatus Krumholzibacteria bacterium]|nr:peptide-binding protein [Candidatus Krumholzibacteria bacterium]